MAFARMVLSSFSSLAGPKSVACSTLGDVLEVDLEFDERLDEVDFGLDALLKTGLEDVGLVAVGAAIVEVVGWGLTGV